MIKRNPYSNFHANFDRDSINNLYSDPRTYFYSDFDMDESRNKTKTNVTIHQAPPEPTCTCAEKVANTPSKTLLPLPSTPARCYEMVEQDEAIQQDANQDDLQEVCQSPPAASDIVLEALDQEESGTSGEPTSLIDRIGERDSEMGSMVL